MKILIKDIPDDGLIIDLKEKSGLEELGASSPVSARLEVRKMEKEVIVTGSIQGNLGLQCSRCLKELATDLDLPVNVVYHPVEELPAERYELKDDEMDTGYYEGEELDLKELLKEQLMLNVQMKPLCDEACKGLCPKCGADLNIETCGCITKEIDPRLEALKNLIEKGKE